MKKYPTHLNDCVEDASIRFINDASDYHKYYQIICRCGCKLFDLLVSDKDSVIGICSECNYRIVIYDLDYYPAATKLDGEESFARMNGMPNRPSQVYALYEYGQLDADMEFDPNDISWFQLFSETKDGQLVKIFDDETA
jgi:hypothetical protein